MDTIETRKSESLKNGKVDRVDDAKKGKRGPYNLKDRDLSESDKLTNNFFFRQRQRLNKNLEEMAHYLNISSRLYWRLENEEIITTKKIMDKIGRKLGVDPVVIFFPGHRCDVCSKCGYSGNRDK
jgi:ribosome-binding protein aMBF1 (putative translation factor)